MTAKAGLPLDTIVEFDWEGALGKHGLSRKELEELADVKTSLVHLRGEWVEVDLDATQEVVDRLDRHESEEVTLRDLLDRLDAGATVDPLSEPDGFESTLRPYQKRRFAWLAFLKRWGLGACLADDMGLGKTVEALALLQRTYNQAAQNGQPEDGPNPCKHIAAVYLLLAEEFDRDPFLLFRLRGMRQGALMDRVGGDVEAALGDADADAPTSPDTEPLQTDEGFWEAPSLPDDVYGAVETPPSHAPLPKQLGKFPLWRADELLVEVLEPVYEAASTEGIALFEAEETLSDEVEEASTVP